MKHKCDECGKKRERCRLVWKDLEGVLHRVCPQCWRDFWYSRYLEEA